MMLVEDFRWLAAVIGEHKAKQLVGRTRLQKEIWLLQRLGLPTEYAYTVHFYGPYSEGLHAETGLLKSLGVLDVELRDEGVERPYYVMQLNDQAGLPIPELPERIGNAIPVLENTAPVVLELAATYDAFRDQGNDHEEAMRRVKRKKGRKCDDGRLDKALELLEKLGLKQ